MNAEPLSFPVEFQELPYVACIANTTRDELIALFGEPTALRDPGDPGPMERWAFRFPCGLQLIYKLNLTSHQTLVTADIPEVAHVARHLPFESDRFTLVTPDELREQMVVELQYYPERKAEFDSLFDTQVWRQGDDGNRFRVGELTSERAARCHVAELESHRHKQLYWYSSHQ